MNSDKNIPPILGCLLFAAAPHILQIPFWITAWCLALWGYLFFVIKYRLPLPGKKIRWTLTVIGIAGIPLTFGIRFGGLAYIGLLLIMAGLKPLEIRSHRDRMISIFLAYFIIITRLLNSESLLLTLYMFPSVLITTAALIHINHPVSHSGGQLKEKIRLSAAIMLQAMPLMIILFFLFPRIQGSIWGMARQSGGRSGFSENLSPGSISNLVLNNETAFRAEFSGPMPNPEFLYWRGIVFDHFDGKSWSQKPRFLGRFELIKGKDIVEYSVIIEPHDKRWLFALDLPIAAPKMGVIMADQTIISYRRLTQKIRYTVQSYLTYNTGTLKRWEQIMLQLPESGNPKAKALAKKWMQEAVEPQKIIEAGLKFFQENGFTYSLNPPLLTENPIDDFLFGTRKGYCEHYASAFAFLMRAANIPARPVGGYLGGEVNPYGNYLIVRQSDAHAWTEVWLDGKGWVRIDPTLAVAPGRVQRGMEGVLSPDEVPAFLSLRQLGGLASYWREIRFGWDAINNQWDIWFMGYSFEEQRDLLSRIGIQGSSLKSRVKGLILAFFLIGIIAVPFSLWLLKKSSRSKDVVQKAYEVFCKKLARISIHRNPSQGPMDFAAMAGSVRKDLEQNIADISRLYILLRYGRGGDNTLIKQLKKMVKDFKPHA